MLPAGIELSTFRLLVGTDQQQNLLNSVMKMKKAIFWELPRAALVRTDVSEELAPPSSG
jgi:hypothetical protein